ncbi:MAG: hypothetical protein ABIN35_00700 [candidate division WOR-3 bacterium]
MGCCCSCCHQNTKIKRGQLYETVKSQMRPLDLLVFRGDDFVSGLISILEKRGYKNAKGGNFTHVGMIVTRDILDDPTMEPNKLYILESVISGRLGYNVTDIHGRSFLGVQIRDLDQLIDAYDRPNQTSIGWCPLLNNPFLNPQINRDQLKQQFTEIYQRINGVMWDANCWSLCSAIYPCCRPCRSCIEQTLHTQDWLFCSEMVALVYQHLNILPSTVNPKDVLPADLVYPNEDTDQMPLIIQSVHLIVSRQHYPLVKLSEIPYLSHTFLVPTELVERI